MSLLDPLEKKTINEGINAVRTTPGAVLVDIRPKEDYEKGHVKGAINIPFDRVDLALHRIPDREKLIYLYGNLSHKPRKSIRAWKKKGYRNVHACGIYEDHHVRPL